jgi:hypothetical protein
MSMPKRPKDQKHDVFAAVAGYANSPDDDGKNKAAQWLGQRGGKARAKALSPERRREIGKKAAKTRWGGA